MNWDAIGAVGEIIGALAVVVTLIYLARQIQTQGKATIGETMSSWLSDYNVLIIEVLRDGEVANILRRGLTDFEVLDGDEQLRFHVWMVAHALNAQNVFLQQQDGIIHKQIAEIVLIFNAAQFKLPGGAYWWKTARVLMRPDFVKELDTRIEGAIPVTDFWPWFTTRAEAIGTMTEPPSSKRL